LGVLTMAARMAEAIRAGSKDEQGRPTYQISAADLRIVRIYGLLHDITHIPFGHTLEDELGLFMRHDANPARINALLGVDSQLGQILREGLGEEEYSRFMQIFLWDDDPTVRLHRLSERGPGGPWERLSRFLRMDEPDHVYI